MMNLGDNVGINIPNDEFVGIYLIYNTKYFYVGQSVHVRKRIKEHQSRLTKGVHENIFMQRVYDKYQQIDPFLYKELICCDPNDLDYFEEYYFDVIKNSNSDYTPMNLMKCGCAGNVEVARKHKSESFKGSSHPWKWKKVVQLDKQGNLIKVWDSICIAEKSLNISINLEKHTSGGYQWQKYDEWLSNPKGKVVHKHNVDDTIKQFSLQGEFIAEYKNIKEASMCVHISPSVIAACLNGKYKTAKDFLWSYTMDPPKYDRKTPRHNRPKKVQKYEGNQLIETFDSLAQAAKSINSNSTTLRSHIIKNQELGGFTWKLIK